MKALETDLQPEELRQLQGSGTQLIKLFTAQSKSVFKVLLMP